MTWQVDIERVGGILEGSATIEPGLNAVRASNWKGKSSFVQAIKTGLGVMKPLTEGESEGHVHLETPERDVQVELVRRNGRVERTGEPYFTDEYDLVRTELFACLDESNEIREAVRRGESLGDVLLRPLDFQNIDQRIADLKRNRERVESELDNAREATKRLPGIQEKVTKLESELEDLQDRYDRLTADDDGAADASPQSAQQDLAQARSTRDQADNQISRCERTIERTRSRLEEKRAELADIEIDADASAVESRLSEAREDLQRIESDIEVLQSVHDANQMVLNENRVELLTDVQRELTGDTITCWTCGSEAERPDAAAMTEELGEKLASLRGQKEQHRDAVETLEARREEITQNRRAKRDLESEVARLEEKLADTREDLQDAKQRRDDAAERVADLSEDVDDSVEQVTDVESDIKYREAELQDARDELAELERRADRVDSLQTEREDIREELEDLRNRKDRIKYEAGEAFDEALQDVLSRFDTGFETARFTADFTLVVARDGREASLDALSEGELELLGFVAALAGYEAFDVDDIVPIMLIDGIGGLADDNVHTLVDYLEDRTEYLVFTVYPEYAAFGGTEISPEDWTIASEGEASDD